VTGYCLVLTTTDSREAARELADSAVRGRLAACAQLVGPIESTYWWDGAVETAAEWQLWFKTTDERYVALAEHVRDRHKYDVPEIVRVPIEAGSPAYLAWLRAETTCR